MELEDEDEIDPNIGRSLTLDGNKFTILARASWGGYYYLGLEDQDESVALDGQKLTREDVIVRPVGAVVRALQLQAS